jgi:AraC-like DNA-binding protein
MTKLYSEITSLSSMAALLAQTLRSCDHDPAPLFARAGIDMREATDPNARISTTRMQTLWGLAVDATGNPCLGLVAAHQFQPAALHGLGFAWLASDTLYDAFGRLVRYHRLINAAVDFRLEDSGDTIDLVIQVPQDLLAGVYASVDNAIASFLRMTRITACKHVMPVHVMLERPEPSCRGEFEEMFGPSIEYGAPANRLCFDKALVTGHLPTALPELARMNDQTVIDYLARFDRDNITMQVRARIIEQLHDGRPNQEAIAKTLHVSLRSLQRRLKDEATSFQELLDTIQHELALQYIRDSRRSIGEITYLLGFSEPSNFTRAFKRWTGLSPAAFRKTGQG